MCVYMCIKMCGEGLGAGGGIKVFMNDCLSWNKIKAVDNCLSWDRSKAINKHFDGLEPVLAIKKCVGKMFPHKWEGKEERGCLLV